MASGVSRKVDRLGRVVLPVEVRRALGIDEGDLIDVAVDAERIVLTKVERGCVFCGASGEAAGLAELNGRLICAACAASVATLRPIVPLPPER